MSDEEIKKAFTTTFRKSFRASHRMSAVRQATDNVAINEKE